MNIQSTTFRVNSKCGLFKTLYMISFFKYIAALFTTLFTKSTLSAREDFKAASNSQLSVIEMLILDSKECKDDRKRLNSDLKTAQKDIQEMNNKFLTLKNK